MKVTILISSLIGGGAERVVCELASYLCDAGHQVEVLTISGGEGSYSIHERVNCCSLDGRARIRVRPLRIGIRMLRLLRYVIRCKNDIYVVFLPETIIALMLFRRLIRQPIVISERNNPPSYPQWLQRGAVWAAKRADGIVFQTSNAKDYYEERIKLNKWAVIPNAVAREFSIPTRSGAKDKVIVTVGRFSEQKNHALLIRAFASIADALPGYTLRIYGKGLLLEEYRALARELGVSDRIQFPGFVRDIREAIENAALFVLSSDYEGIPNALMEAMALGLPCISTDCQGGGARAVMQNGVNGLLVPAGDINALACAMQKLLTDQELASKLGNNAKRINREFAFEKIYGQWEEFLTGFFNSI